MKYGKSKLIGILALSVFVILLVYLRQGKDFKKEIKEGKLCYTSKGGWINWGHAKPERVKSFIELLRQRWELAQGESFEVSYEQHMNGSYWGVISVESRLERTYRINAGLAKSDLEWIAWGIFKDVSEAFENMQGSCPNSLDAKSQDSSFRDGDLLGNRIAFYRSLRGYSEQEVRQCLEPVDQETSLMILRVKQFTKNHEWKMRETLAGGKLDDVVFDELKFKKHSKMLREVQTWFKFRLLL